MTIVRKVFSGRAAALILVAVLVVPALGAKARVCCGFDFVTTYYSDCPAKLHEVGFCETDCFGVKTCEGTKTTCQRTTRTCCNC